MNKNKIVCLKEKMKIKLTNEEKNILKDCDDLQLSNFSKEKGIRASNLFKLLYDRNAIPNHRWNWFYKEPEVGRKISVYEDFQKSKNPNWMSHGHFWSYIKYFINGPDISPEVISEFSLVFNTPCGWKDLLKRISPLKKILKNDGRSKKQIAEEMWKLAYEYDETREFARLFRDKFMR